jgi:hypothetical protein
METPLFTWVDTHCYFGLVRLLGRLGSGRQPSNKTGEAGEPRRAAAPSKSDGLPATRCGGAVPRRTMVARRTDLGGWGKEKLTGARSSTAAKLGGGDSTSAGRREGG